MSNMLLAIQLVIEAMRAPLNRIFTIKSQHGGINIEYAMIALLISVVAVGVIQVIGETINGMYVSLKNGFP